MGRPATAKKDRLIDAAMTSFHHHGVAASSIVAVARAADVAPGNVYYYFRSKDALTAAVIARWCDLIEASLAAHATRPDPIDRLRSFVSGAADRRQGYTDHGCPLAALGADLRADPALAAEAARPLAIMRAWLVDQFTAAHGDRAAALSDADFCLSGLQGAFALAHATGDPAIIARTVDRLIDWIGSIARPI